MSIYQFMQLDAHDQLEAWFEGAFVGRQATGLGREIVCKQIDDFYVEYLKVDGVWSDMRAFRNPDLLAPYLSQIDVNELGI